MVQLVLVFELIVVLRNCHTNFYKDCRSFTPICKEKMFPFPISVAAFNFVQASFCHHDTNLDHLKTRIFNGDIAPIRFFLDRSLGVY